VLVGDAEVLENILNRRERPASRLSISHADMVVGREEAPKVSLRKKTSSISVAADLVTAAKADGARLGRQHRRHVATTVQKWRTLEAFRARPGHRPAASLPPVVLLDVGANIRLQAGFTPARFLRSWADLRPARYSAAATPGSACSTSARKKARATRLAKAATSCSATGTSISSATSMGGDIFKGTADVVVCDGFVGNVVLKFAEGFFSFIGHYIKTAMPQAHAEARVRPDDAAGVSRH
jgi:glycerol-3-phosphate acyltransferase PlsX